MKNSKKAAKPVRLHIGLTTLESLPGLRDVGLYLGDPFSSWSDVPEGTLKRAVDISDFTLFEHPKLVAEILEEYRNGFLPAIRAIARNFSPTDKLPDGVTHWVWFPVSDKRFGSSFAYCHAVDPDKK